MTMLDRMRRHKSWLKWSLGIIVVAFVLVYVPQFLDPTGTGAATNDVVATVDGRRITANTLQRVYLQQLSQLRASYSQLTDDMIRQLGFGQRMVQQLVAQEAQVAEAERLGLSVSDGELRERLVRLPMFQQNGAFVGETMYRQMLNGARPPVRPDEFEADLRNLLLTEKLEHAVTGSIRISDADVEGEFRRRNEKVRVDLATFNANDFRTGLDASAAEVDAEFNRNKEAYRLPEKRRVRYISIDRAALKSKMAVSAAETDARYRQNQATYSTPDQVRASHILFATAGKTEADVQKTAEGVLARARKGEDFAALAKQYSDDEPSKVNGGDLDFFAKGAMVPEFDDAVWKLTPGEISGLVKTQYGFHIIRLAEKRAAMTRTLDQVRTQIEDQLRTEKADAEAQRLSEVLAKAISSPADLDVAAKANGLTVGDSGLFAASEPLAGLGFAPAVAAQAFALEKDKTSGLIATTQGFAFIAVTEIQPSALPTLDVARDKVQQAVISAKAIAAAHARAAALADSRPANFAAAAKAAGTTVKSTDLIARGSVLPDVGTSTAVDTVIFALKVGETSQPVATDTAVVVAHLRERQDIDASALAAQKDMLRSELTTQRRQAFFGAYMDKAMKRMAVTYNEAAISQVVGN